MDERRHKTDKTDKTAAAVRDRLARHFLARLRREMMLETIERAIHLGVLERVEHPHGLSVFRQGRGIVGWTLARVRLHLRRAFGMRSDATDRTHRSPAAATIPTGWELDPEEDDCGGDVRDVPLAGAQHSKVRWRQASASRLGSGGRTRRRSIRPRR